MTTPTRSRIFAAAAAVCAVAVLSPVPAVADPGPPHPAPSVGVRIDPTAGVEVTVRGPRVDVGATVRPPAAGGCGAAVEAGAAPPGVRVRVSDGAACAPPPPPPPPETSPPPPPEPAPAPREPAPEPPPPSPTPTPPPEPSPKPSPTPSPSRPPAVAAHAVTPRQEPHGDLSMVTRTLLVVAPAVLAAAALRPRSSRSSR